MHHDATPTILAPSHQALGAKMAPFAGFFMPIQYVGIIAEHQHTRRQASLFDICHMGEFLVSGSRAMDALSRALSHNLATLAPGRCRYGFLLNEAGGVIDDCIVYCLQPDSYMIVVNGARIDIDRETLQSRLDGVDFQDISDETGKLDLQGPASLDALETLMGMPMASIPYFGFLQTAWRGEPLLVSRTGYTGELGYEIYCPMELAPALWEALLAIEPVLPAGLGARDTLRLEVGLPLYGHDLDERHTPAEAGYGGLPANPADYVGKGADAQVRQRLLGLRLEGKRAARHGDAVLLGDREVGVVTSGSFCPTVGAAVALAYVDAAHAPSSTGAGAEEFIIRAARAELPARRVSLPFFTQGTARKKLL